MKGQLEVQALSNAGAGVITSPGLGAHSTSSLFSHPPTLVPMGSGTRRVLENWISGCFCLFASAVYEMN